MFKFKKQRIDALNGSTNENYYFTFINDWFYLFHDEYVIHLKGKQ